jgi:hypothetical protein
MKKVLFLAVAALAYVGAANAQTTLDGSGTAIVSQGSKSYVASSGDLSQIFNLTRTGTYDFYLDRTDWSSLTAPGIGTNWNSVINGSIVTFSGATESSPAVVFTDDATYPIASAGYKGEGKYEITAPSTGTLTNAEWTETVYDLNSKPACGVKITASFTLKDVPTISITDSKDVICLNSITGSFSIPYTSTGQGSSTVKYTLSKVSPSTGTSGDIYADKYVALDISNGTSSFSIQQTDISSVGLYTLTLTEIMDEYLVEASNASPIGALSSNNKATFTVMPSPVPTLKSSAK